jgi:hypothetical protein
VRTTLLLSLMCLPYLVFGSVIWAAYHQFGERSLLDQAPLVVADQTPLKLNPGPHLRDRVAVEKVGLPEHRLLSAGRQSPTEPSEAAGRAALAALQFKLDASDGAATAPLGQVPIAAIPAGAPAETTLATPVEVVEPAPGSMPPKPSFKPLEMLPAASVELAPPAERTVAARLDLRRSPPPRPALKPPVALPRERSEWRAAPDAPPVTRAVAATDRGLPEALRAWWSNLKILLASGPASPAMRAGGDDSDRQAPRGDIGAAVANAGAEAGGGRSDPGGGADARGGGGAGDGTTGGGNDRATGDRGGGSRSSGGGSRSGNGDGGSTSGGSGGNGDGGDGQGDDGSGPRGGGDSGGLGDVGDRGGPGDVGDRGGPGGGGDRGGPGGGGDRGGPGDGGDRGGPGGGGDRGGPGGGGDRGGPGGGGDRGDDGGRGDRDDD